MRKLRVTALTFMVAGFSVSTAAQARDVVLEYRLPKTIVGFAASHMITKCPDANGNGFEMEVTTSASEVYRAGETVKVNAAGSVFIDRQIKIEYFSNGTIKSFNGTSDGQGEELIVAGIRAISFAASSSVSANVVATATANSQANSTVTCQDWVKTALADKQATQANLSKLRQTVFTTDVPENLAIQIAEATALIAALEASLTVQSEPVYWTPSLQSIAFRGKIEAPSLIVWFNPSQQSAIEELLLRSGYGQMTKFSLEGDLTISGSPIAVSDKPIRSLAYRKPVRATVTIKPENEFTAPATLSGASRALAILRHGAMTKVRQPMVPQVGPLAEVPFDGSSIFGSRSVSANFTEAGDLTQISYTNKGGASAIAGVLNATKEAAKEQQDARLNAFNRKIEILTAEEDLRDRIKAKAPAE
jgi:hypothetical protein